MSLKVWLPLNGDLHNQGCSNLMFTQSGTAITIDNNGKIGQCYNRATAKSAGRITSDNTILLDRDLSMCCWAKVTATVGDTANGLVTNHNAGSNSNFGINVKQISTDDYRISCSTGNGSARTYMTYYGTTNIKNNWHHLALTYNNTTHIFQLWVDGIVEKTQSYTNSATAQKIMLFDWNVAGTNNNYKPACMLNDVRIYDHCLSAAEVHEISQGLVLHYKLDDNAQTITNAFNMTSWNTNTARGGFSSWGSSGHQGSYGANTDRNYIYNADRTYSYWVANGSESTPLTYLFYQSPAFEGGYRSLSAILKEENGNLITEDIIRPAWNANVAGDGHAPAAKWTRVTSLGNGFYLCQVDGLYQDGSNDLAGLNVTRGHKVYISEIWLENNRQVASNPLFPATQIQDSSGYGHNGTITGNLTLNNNTARYSTSTYISSGDTNYITTPTLQLPGDQITMNFWFRSTNTAPGSNYHMPFEGSASSNQSYEMSIYKTGYLRGGLVIGGSRKVDNCTSTKLLNGNWHMCSMTYDGTIIKRYVDGVMEKSTAATGILVTSTSFVLGHYGSNTSYCAKEVYISDVRLYVTALSEADIKQLYEMGAKVDNKHSIHSYELVEYNTNKITKTGQLHGDNIHEIPDLFAYDPILYIEPDGSQWAHIFHHNNPTSYKFASTDTFTSFVYTDENRWFNFAPCDLLPTYEFYAAVAKTAGAAITKYRWIQSASPLTATFDSTKSANVTKITTTGYTSCPFGGLYHVSGSSWLAMNNGTNNNWYGATGCWTAWNGGIPGWASTASGNAITTGSIDIYVRIDNINFSQINLTSKSIKTNKWQANQFIEL